MKRRYLAAAVLLLSMLCVGQGPVTIRGANAEILRLDAKSNAALIRVTNTSEKDITAFVLTVSAVHANGRVDRDERMTDLVLTMIPKQRDDTTSSISEQLLHPGENREETASLTPISGNPITNVTVTVAVIAYADQTAEVANEEAFGRLLAERQGNLLARRRSLEIINKALSNPAAMHPITDAIVGLQELHVRPRTQQDVSWNGEVASVIRDLQNLAERSMERDSTGALSLRGYAARKQKESALLGNHTELRRQP